MDIDRTLIERSLMDGLGTLSAHRCSASLLPFFSCPATPQPTGADCLARLLFIFFSTLGSHRCCFRMGLGKLCYLFHAPCRCCCCASPEMNPDLEVRYVPEGWGTLPCTGAFQSSSNDPSARIFESYPASCFGMFWPAGNQTSTAVLDALLAGR